MHTVPLYDWEKKRKYVYQHGRDKNSIFGLIFNDIAKIWLRWLFMLGVGFIAGRDGVVPAKTCGILAATTNQRSCDRQGFRSPE